MRKLLIAALVFVAGLSAQAGVDGYFMLSLFSPGQLPVPMTHLYGGRLVAFYGECQELFGLDLGGVGRVRERMYGVQLGAGHLVGTDAAGLQVGLYESVESEFDGLQVGVWTEVAGNARGAEIGICNFLSVDPGVSYAGCQLGVANFTETGYGCQLGVFNKAFTYTGLQLGLVNWTQTLNGCQLGLVNVSAWHKCPCLPFINVRW